MPPPQQQQSQDRPPIFDGQTDFSGGMDSSRSPELINPNQIAVGVNISVRGGYPETRPAFMRRNVDFGDDLEAESWWHSNLFQGYSYYNLNGFFPCLIASVGGRIFNLQPIGNDFRATDITPFKSDGTTLDRNSAWLYKAYFAVAATYLIIQDGQSYPFIFDGSTLRRANPAVPEVPVGTIMAYGQARLVVGFGNQFLVGDILGGATNVISFTETTYLNGGGAFILPQNMGNITGMIFQAAQDTQTGQGGLLVFGETGCISVNLLIPREQWQQNQITTVTLTDIGASSDRTLTTVNADILFRSQDGIRSYRDARAEFGPYSVGNFGRTAMSYEVFEWLDTDFQQWLKFSSGIIFDNRYLMTTLPIMRTYGVPIFQAMTAMDFIAVSALRYNQPPVFDGFWTGPDIYQLATGKFFGGPRAFAACRAADSTGTQQLQIWEITKQQGLDNGVTRPVCSVDSRSFPFSNLLSYKRMNFLRHWADKIQGRVDWTLRIRPDQYPGWKFWQTWTDDAKVQTCQNTTCNLPNYQPQYRAGRNSVLATDELTSDGQSLSTARTGFSFQFRLEWTGIARLTKFLLSAQSQDIPKLDALIPSPPEDPLTAILGAVMPVAQYYNEEVTYVCPAGTTGTPVVVPAGAFSSFISVADANANALEFAMSEASCVSLIPAVTSNSETVGVSLPFSYQIVATNGPILLYGQTGLPTGLNLNTSTGLITGTITSTSVTTYTVPISATNLTGTGSGILTINVIDPVGVFFFYGGSPGVPLPGLTSMQIALDGGSYSNVIFSPSTNISPTYFGVSQIKYRMEAAATYSSGGLHTTQVGHTITYNPGSRPFLSSSNVTGNLNIASVTGSPSAEGQIIWLFSSCSPPLGETDTANPPVPGNYPLSVPSFTSSAATHTGQLTVQVGFVSSGTVVVGPSFIEVTINF